MSLAGFALKRSYTIISLIMLVCVPAVGAAQRMPTGIFPEIDIPVASVVWIYNA
jgi:multidrug efflux pump subunit AcrB